MKCLSVLKTVSTMTSRCEVIRRFFGGNPRISYELCLHRHFRTINQQNQVSTLP